MQPVPTTPAQGERHVHFSPGPEPADEAPHQTLIHRHSYQSQSDTDDLFTGPGRNAMTGRIFSHPQVCFFF